MPGMALADTPSREKERYYDPTAPTSAIACALESVPYAPMRIGTRGRVDHPGHRDRVHAGVIAVPGVVGVRR